MGRLPFVASLAFVLASACGGGESSSSSGGDPTNASSGTTPGGGASSSGEPSGGAAAPSGDGGTTSGGPPAPKATRFIAIGDTGTGSNDQKKVANAMSAVCKARGCDFVQLLGDNLYDSGASSVDDPIWQEKFEVPYAAIDIDFFAVLGNHDYGHGGAGTDFNKGKNEIDYTSKSKKWKMPAAYYRHTKNNVEIFGLDTNMQMFGRDSAQKRDVSDWIAASKATWKIAVGHHPYKSNGPHGNAGKYDGTFFPPVNGSGVKSFLEDVVCGNVDLYLSGHDHSRQWLNESCKGTELAVSGAGAKATELDGDNAVLFQSLELGFLYIVVEDRTLTAEFIDDSGNVEFSHVMKK